MIFGCKDRPRKPPRNRQQLQLYAFSSTRHPVVFEGIKINGETPEIIQKLISAPILIDGKVIGVIQISRKERNASGVGPDFTSDDLGNLLALCKPLGKLLQRAAKE